MRDLRLTWHQLLLQTSARLEITQQTSAELQLQSLIFVKKLLKMDNVNKQMTCPRNYCWEANRPMVRVLHLNSVQAITVHAYKAIFNQSGTAQTAVRGPELTHSLKSAMHAQQHFMVDV